MTGNDTKQINKVHFLEGEDENKTIACGQSGQIKMSKNYNDVTCKKCIRKHTQVLFSRDEYGCVDIGDAVVKVPANRSALGILGYNKVFDGDHFDEDGMVYDEEGNAYRRWFIQCDEMRVWEPHLDDISKIESARWRAWNRAMGRNARWQQEVDKIAALRNFKAKREGGWVEFGRYWKSERGAHWSWIFKGDKLPRKTDQKAADDFFAIEKWHEEGYRMSWKMSILLLEAVNRKYGRKYDTEWRGTPFYLVINGRTYWFQKRHGSCRVEYMAKPEDGICGEVVS